VTDVLNDPRLADRCRDPECLHTRRLHTHHHFQTYCGGVGCRCPRFWEPPRDFFWRRWARRLRRLRPSWAA
jgi:hypothetical protein